MIIFDSMDQHIFEGQDLRVDDIISILGERFELSETVWNRVSVNRAAFENLIKNSDTHYYGINTGFGSLYNIGISHEQIRQLQTNLLRSHACGLGPAVPSNIVRLTLLLKIISLAQGHSAVRKEVIQFLIELYNNNIVPVVPSLGSLGASGDLAPLAHLFLPIIGEGDVVFKREQMASTRALQVCGIDTLQLEAKEGLALINGTQYSLAWLIFAIDNATRLSEVIDMCTAMSMDAFDCHPSPLDKDIHYHRRQTGQ